MTHFATPSGNFPDSHGPWQPCRNPVIRCQNRECTAKGAQIHYQEVDSNGHDDVHLKCVVCGKSWWVEGDDG